MQRKSDQRLNAQIQKKLPLLIGPYYDTTLISNIKSASLMN